MEFLVGAAAAPIRSKYFFLPSISLPSSKSKRLIIFASSTFKTPNPLLRSLRTTISGAVLLTATSAALLSGKARAEPSAPPPSTVQTISAPSETTESESKTSSLSEILNSSEQLTETLRNIIYTKLQSASDDEETLSLLRKVISSRPSEAEWKLLAVKLLSDNHEFAEARKLLEEVLAEDPLSQQALQEFAIVMHLAGEDFAVYQRLEEAVEIAKRENKEHEVREIRFIKAQMLLLQRKFEEALKNFEELRDEDPEDYRPYFAQGMIYSLMDKDKEAKEVFGKLKEISGDDFEVESFLQKGMSRIMSFGYDGAGTDKGNLRFVS